MRQIAIDKALPDILGKGNLKVFETGVNAGKGDILDRPFVSLLGDFYKGSIARISFDEGMPRQPDSAAPALKVTPNDPKTAFSKEIEDLEKRFARLDPDAVILFVDPDVIRNRGVIEQRRPDEIFAEQLQVKLEQATRRKAFGALKLPDDEREDLRHATLAKDFPYTLTMDVKDDKRFCLIVPGQPDAPLPTRLSNWLDNELSLNENLPMSRQQFQSAIIYHEIGHSLDNKIGKGDADKANDVDVRLREESLADTFAILEMTKESGSTDFAKAFSDTRAVMTDQIATNLTKANADGAQALCYFSSPVMDATIKQADKMLADGSLAKMDDKALFAFADEMVGKHMPGKDKLDQIAKGLGGEKNTEHKQFAARVAAAQKRVLSTTANENANIEQAPTYSKPGLWRLGLMKKLAESGNDMTATVQTINAERDKQRAGEFGKGGDRTDVLESFLHYPDYAVQDGKNYIEACDNISKVKASKPKDPVSGFTKNMDSYFKSAAKLDKLIEAGEFDKAQKELDGLRGLEKTTQLAAHAIRGDKKLWAQASKDKNIAPMIEAKARGIVPFWLVSHSNSVANKQPVSCAQMINTDKTHYAQTVKGAAFFKTKSGGAQTATKAALAARKQRG